MNARATYPALLAQRLVGDVIVLQGTNDLASSPAAGAGQIIAVLRTIIRRLNRNGLRAVVGTLLPADTPRSPKTRDR